MIYLNAFIFCGIVCMISQLILDNTKLTPGHVTSLFVVIGAFLDIFGIYDKIVLYCGAGAIVPITSFGHLLVHGAMDMANELGPLGLSFGIFNLTSAGISIAIVSAFTLALFFKSKN
ncbi:MAG: SpoVA/SpoVAEb family sporulation membrane protein [Bacilli bacterium]|nr:SpoVA/SpoVAEb family sporulation membrane protein [Bacilli bacterium]